MKAQLVAASLAISSAAAAAPDESVATATTPPQHAARPVDRDGRSVAPRNAVAQRASEKISVDGALDELSWSEAPAHGDFWQREPDEGAPARYPTEFRVLYDHDAIYVGVRCSDPQPARIRGLLTRRDQMSSSDWVTVELDSYHDRRTAFSFSLNAVGVQRDVLLFNDIESDESWDAVWTGATRIDDAGWVAEFRIPYSQLRFSTSERHTWGLQVKRTVQRDAETSLWAPWPKSKTQQVSLYGDLDGIAGITPPRRIELLPYVVAGGALYESDGDPLNDGVDGTAGAGLDAKLGIGPNFTVTATINPDFGQVEADPSQVNLTASETFFAEKRPFFVEGTDIFRFSLGQGDGDNSVESLFYTRRIGASPHAFGTGDYVTQPDATTIYGAAKLSGKTASGWSIGVVEAITGKEEALVIDSAGNRERQVIEPLTNYSVTRIKKHLNDGRTELGGAITTTHRAVDGLDLEDSLHRQAYAGGLQLTHRFWDDTWSGNFRLVGSHVRGSESAIDATQRSSVHYFQRPDADHTVYDPTRNALSGGGALWDIGKMAGGHTRFTIGGDAKSPGLEVNDLGFQRSADYYVQWAWGQYRDDTPGAVLRNYVVNLNGWTVWTWGREHLNTGGNVNFGGTLLSYWGGHFGFSFDRNRQDPAGLRGGPMLRLDPSVSGWFSLWSDSRKRVNASVDGSLGLVPASDGWRVGLTPWVNVQVASNIEVGAGPQLSRQNDDVQFVEEVADTAGEPVFVLGRIDQITAALTLRMSYTFTPRLSLQVYAQPFVATGKFENYKEVIDPQATDRADRYDVIDDDQVMDVDGERSVDRDRDGVADYTFSLAEFDFRELRSNVVVRWEYAPGSALFLIWSHNRTSVDDVGSFTLSEELGALADQTGEHVLLLKLNYWLGV